MSLQRRRLLASGIGLLGAHRVGRTQPAATIRRVGILHVGSEAEGAGLRTPFKQGMNDLGWLEGKNVEYRVAAAAGDVNRLVVASAPADLAGAVEQIVRQRAQAVVVVPDAMYHIERIKLQQLLQATRLPLANGHRDNVVAGGPSVAAQTSANSSSAWQGLAERAAGAGSFNAATSPRSNSIRFASRGA